MKCTSCGKEGEGMITLISIASQSASYMCPTCQAEQASAGYHDVKEIDGIIAQWEEQIAELESIIKRVPEMPDVPPELAALAFTPLTIYKSAQTMLAHLKSRRMTLVTQQGSAERLDYALKQAIEAEDFEEAAKVRDQIRELNGAEAKKEATRQKAATD